MKIGNKTSLNITCPACGKQIHQTVGWFTEPGQSCPHCGTPVESEAYRKGFEEIERKLSGGLIKAGDQLAEALRRIGDIKIGRD